MKMVKKIVATILATTLITGTLVACSNSNIEDETTTTKPTKIEITTEEPTTEEITTEEPTTEPGEFIRDFYVKEEHLKYFTDLVVEPGYIFTLNDIVPDYAGIVNRGFYAKQIVDIGENNVGDRYTLQDMYLEVGGSSIAIPYEDNLRIKYLGDKRLIFVYIGASVADGEYEFKVYSVD